MLNCSFSTIEICLPRKWVQAIALHTVRLPELFPRMTFSDHIALYWVVKFQYFVSLDLHDLEHKITKILCKFITAIHHKFSKRS